MLEELHRTYVTLQDTTGRLYLSPKSQAEANIVATVRVDLDKALKSLEDALGITEARATASVKKAAEEVARTFHGPSQF